MNNEEAKILSDDQIAEVWKQREPDHYPSGAVKIDAITRNDNLRTLIDSHRALHARLRRIEDLELARLKSFEEGGK